MLRFFFFFFLKIVLLFLFLFFFFSSKFFSTPHTPIPHPDQDRITTFPLFYLILYLSDRFPLFLLFFSSFILFSNDREKRDGEKEEASRTISNFLLKGNDEFCFKRKNLPERVGLISLCMCERICVCVCGGRGAHYCACSSLEIIFLFFSFLFFLKG